MDTKSSGTSGKGKRDWRSLAKRDWLAFDRSDFVGTTVILSLAVVGTVLLGLLVPVVEAIRNSPLPVSYTTKLTSGFVLPRGATHDGFATMDLLLMDATPGERLMQALPSLMGSAMTIAVCWMLFRLLRSIQAGEPFTRANVRRINVIALIVGLVGTLAQFAQGIADNRIPTSGRLPDSASATLVFEMSITPIPLVMMLVIALVGEAFRRGVQLREDVEGLV